MASSGSESPRVRLSRSKAGPVRAALDAALESARTADRLTTGDELVGAMARQVAGVVDAAWRADDPRLLLASSRDLVKLVGRLPVECSAVPRDGDAGGADDDGGTGDVDDEVARVMGAGPTVGDAEDA